VDPDDSREVHPTDTTTYKLEAAKGGEITVAFVTIAVTSPPPTDSESPPKRPGHSSAEILAAQLHDVHFDYGKDQILSEDQSILATDALVLKNVFQKDPDLLVTIEGHCDERGSAEYNIGLGDRRANFIKDNLVRLGVPGDKLNTLSYGKERPICLEVTEDCFVQSRRAHFSLFQ